MILFSKTRQLWSIPYPDLSTLRGALQGVGHMGEFVTTVTPEVFDHTFNINVKAVLFAVQKALPLFRDGGSILLNSSIAHLKGMPGASVYSASKAAVRAFARLDDGAEGP